VLEGPLVEIVLGDHKGQMTLVVGVEGNALMEGSGKCNL